MDFEKELETEIALLREIATFDVLDAEALRILAISAEEKTLAAQDVLFRAGETADCGYILASGRLALVDPQRPEGRQVVQEIHAVALVGETALIAAGPRPATAVAMEPSVVLRLSRAAFLKVLEANPASAAKLRRAFAKRLERMMKALDSVRVELEAPRPAPRRR